MGWGITQTQSMYRWWCRVSRKGAKTESFTQGSQGGKDAKVSMTENEISKVVFDLCVLIHKKYGPGLFESVYEEVFCYELSKMDIPFTRQQGIPLVHEEIKMEIGFRADLIIENKVIIELKSVEALAEVHFKQLLTYLKLTDIKLGMLINFNVPLIKDGIHRIANKL